MAAPSRCICRAFFDGGRSQDKPAHDEAPPGGSGTSILVVEDSPQTGAFAKDALIELGYRATLVCNASNALEKLAGNASRFDVVFGDVAQACIDIRK